MNWLRSKAYVDFFESLDQDGGFFYERWGDAPVHSIAAGLMLPKDQIHFFNDIAYYHVPFTHCPTGEKHRQDLKCHCNPKDNFDWKGYSCTLSSLEIFRATLIQACRHIEVLRYQRYRQTRGMGKPARLNKPFGKSPIHVFLHFLVVQNFFFQKLWFDHTTGGIKESRRRLGRGLAGRIRAMRLFYRERDCIHSYQVHNHA